MSDEPEFPRSVLCHFDRGRVAACFRGRHEPQDHGYQQADRIDGHKGPGRSGGKEVERFAGAGTRCSRSQREPRGTRFLHSSFLRKQESRNCPRKRALVWTPDRVRGDSPDPSGKNFYMASGELWAEEEIVTAWCVQGFQPQDTCTKPIRQRRMIIACVLNAMSTI